MANNLNVRDADSLTRTVKSTETGGVHTPHHNVDALPGNLTGKAEDGAAQAADVGLPVLGVRNDGAASKTGTDGDYTMIATDSAGRVGIADLGGSITVDGQIDVTPQAPAANDYLPVRLTDGASFYNATGGGGGGAAQADRSGFTDGAGVLTPMGGVLNETATDPTEDQAAAVRITAKRAWHVNLRNASGGELGTATDPVNVEGAVTVSDGGGTLSIDDAGGSLTVDGAVTVSGTVTANAGTGTRASGGDVAHDSADSGNPVKIGGKARQTNPAAVADGDRVDATFDDVGRQVVVLNAARDLETHAKVTLSNTTETTLLAAAGSGVFLDVTKLLITNTSSTAVRVDLRDATGGTVQLEVAIAANGGAVIDFAVPLRQTTANNAWTAQLSAAVSDVRVFMQAVKNV